MKKFLSMALAATMIMSMAAVAFAAENVSVSTGDIVKVKRDAAAAVPAEYNFDSTYYILLDGDIEKASDIKVKANWERGGEYVESVKVAPVMSNGKAVYGIAIVLKEQPTSTSTKDIIGTVTLSASKSKYTITGAGDSNKLDIDVALSVKNATAGDASKTGDDVYIHSFGDGDEEQEIELYAEAGKFVVNTIGQGKLVIKTTVDYNKGIENVAPDVNYTYFNGNNATFNRLGDLYLNAKEDEFLYKVNSDGTLTKVDAKYDSDEEAFVVRTRVIGSYVISEKELDVEKVNAGVNTPEETAPVAPTAPVNPGTGAAC